jgi:hypothetical protein
MDSSAQAFPYDHVTQYADQQYYLCSWPNILCFTFHSSTVVQETVLSNAALLLYGLINAVHVLGGVWVEFKGGRLRSGLDAARENNNSLSTEP